MANDKRGVGGETYIEFKLSIKIKKLSWGTADSKSLVNGSYNRISTAKETEGAATKDPLIKFLNRGVVEETKGEEEEEYSRNLFPNQKIVCM